MIRGSDPLLRRNSDIAVLRQLRTAASRNLTELTKSTGLSRTTIEDAVDELVELGLATELAADTPTKRPVGRPAKRFAFRSDAGVALACDISVRYIRVFLADLNGAVFARSETTVDPDLPATPRLEIARQAIQTILSEQRISSREVWAAGVSTTGIVDSTGLVLRSSRLPGWSGKNLAAEIQEVLPAASVTVGNDARCAAMAEHWRGSAKDAATSVTVLAGTTIAAAVTIDGKPYLGHHGASGEIGGLVELGWPKAAATLTRLGHYSDEGDARPRSEPLTRADGSKYREVLTEFIEEFALGLITLVTIVDPQRVIIGGELASAGDLLTAPLQERLDAACLFPVPVVSSTLGEAASAFGALWLALNDIETWLFDASGVSRDRMFGEATRADLRGA